MPGVAVGPAWATPPIRSPDRLGRSRCPLPAARCPLPRLSIAVVQGMLAGVGLPLMFSQAYAMADAKAPGMPAHPPARPGRDARCPASASPAR
ncbi:hypothetical protein [Streptomyces sp. NPDC051738]|uniref:hypothetical protein n=1 Tax=Streptomyces sp. NPDC051738 TaxID=3365672 RepID=UPI0037D4581D